MDEKTRPTPDEMFEWLVQRGYYIHFDTTDQQLYVMYKDKGGPDEIPKPEDVIRWRRPEPLVVFGEPDIRDEDIDGEIMEDLNPPDVQFDQIPPPTGRAMEFVVRNGDF